MSQRLDLHKLTKHDIQLFVEDRLTKDENFANLVELDKGYNQLVATIVKRARGVFLWVFLVVDSLLRGIHEDDDISDLQTRLNALPADLNKYFWRIFENIDEEYHQQVAQILLMLSQRPIGSLPIVTIEAVLESSRKPRLALEADFYTISEEKIRESLMTHKKRLNARCKDSLSVVDCKGEWISSRIDARYHVDFQHRTMRDFIIKPEVELFLKKWAPNGFDPQTATCRGSLLHAKGLPPIAADNTDKSCLNPYRSCIVSFLRCCAETELLKKSPEVALIDEMSRTISTLIPGGVDRFSSLPKCLHLSLLTSGNSTDLLAFAISLGLKSYVEVKFQGQAIPTCDASKRPLLDYTVFSTHEPTIYDPDWLHYEQRCQIQYLRPELMELLLPRGANPNECLGIHGTDSAGFPKPDQTIWTRVVDSLGSLEWSIRKNRTHQLYDFSRDSQAIFKQIQLMLRFGADANQDPSFWKMVEQVFTFEQVAMLKKELVEPSTCENLIQTRC